MSEPQIYVGLDLGQTQDYSAAVVLKRFTDAIGRAVYTCPAIKRWPLGSSYCGIVSDLEKMFAVPPLAGALLIVDITGCGKPTYDFIVQTRLNAHPRGVLITGGQAETRQPQGMWHVSKTILIAATRLVLQRRRIQFAEAMPETALIVKEMQSYRLKYTLQAHEVYAAKDSDHDDLVMALSLALWAAERHDRWQMQIYTMDSVQAELRAAQGSDTPPADGLCQEWRERLPGYQTPAQIEQDKWIEEELKKNPYAGLFGEPFDGQDQWRDWR